MKPVTFTNRMARKMTRKIALPAVLTVILAVVVFASGAAAQEGASLTVVADALNVRGGPGVDYPSTGTLASGDVVPIVGRDAESGWWQVKLADGSTGWVTGVADYVSVSGDTSGITEAEAAQPAAATGTGGTIVLQASSGGPIYAVNPDGSNLRYLTTGIDPAISPDGKQVAFTRWESTSLGAEGSIWTINVDGSGERHVAGFVNQPKSPTWSPDGTRIVISMQRGGRLVGDNVCEHDMPPMDAEDVSVRLTESGEVLFCYNRLPDPHRGLALLDTATGNSEDLPRDVYSNSPAWNPVNDWEVVYAGDKGLVGMDVKQGTTWQLTDDTNDHTPVFSPDGSRIAVTYRQNANWEIHVMNADGTGRIRLTETPLTVLADQSIKGGESRPWNNASATWSPDGSQIAFLSDRNGDWEIWLMNADGSNQHPLFPDGAPDWLKIEYYGMEERAISWR